MSEESEKQVREPRAPYTATAETAIEERLLERLQVQFPPYFDRFLEERDRRLSSELERLEAAIEHNGAEIARLLKEMNRRFAEAKEDLESLRVEMDRRFAETKESLESLRVEMDRRSAEAKESLESLRVEMDRRFAEAKEERDLLRAEMRSQFRWIIGLLFPLVAGMLAIIVRIFLVGTF